MEAFNKMASTKVIIYDPTGSKKTPVELPDDVADRFRHQLEVVVHGPSPAPAGDGGRKSKVSPDA